jgi:hypothetical protein
MVKINSKKNNMAIHVAILIYRKYRRGIWYKQKINMATIIAILIVQPLGLTGGITIKQRISTG